MHTQNASCFVRKVHFRGVRYVESLCRTYRPIFVLTFPSLCCKYIYWKVYMWNIMWRCGTAQYAFGNGWNGIAWDLIYHAFGYSLLCIHAKYTFLCAGCTLLNTQSTKRLMKIHRTPACKMSTQMMRNSRNICSILLGVFSARIFANIYWEVNFSIRTHAVEYVALNTAHQQIRKQQHRYLVQGSY